jgi:hypothetical protein
VLVIFTVTKFTTGAWFVVILIPTLVFIFFRIHYHYKDVARSLSLKGARPSPVKRPMRTIILTDDVHSETVRMVDFAKSLGHPWEAVHVAVSPEKAELVQKKWAERIGEGTLVVLDSPYRALAEPIREFIENLKAETPNCFVHVIMGQLVMDTFWEQALHQNTALIFNLALSRMEGVAVTAVPYQVHRHGRDGQPNTQAAQADAIEAADVEASAEIIPPAN